MPTLSVIRNTVAQVMFDMTMRQAISNVRLVREPTAVTVKFDTVFATFATVELFRMVHGELSLDMEKENLAGTSVELFGNAQDKHAVFVSGLEQERRYWFRISVPRRSEAEPAATGSIRARGEFATLRRDTFVDIEQLHIIDDSDTTSAGDLRFSYALYDASAAGNPRLIEPRFAGEFDVSSGEDIEAPFGAGINIGRAPNRIAVYVDGQDSDTNAWAGPWQGLPVVGMRPPSSMPAETSSFSNIGFDGSDALRLFALKRFLGRNSVPFSFPSAQGALHYDVRGRFITEVSDTLGRRPEPVWKAVVRSKMKLSLGGRPSGMAAVRNGLLGLALTPAGGLLRQETGPEAAWQELDGPALGELLVQPVAEGGLILIGLDAEGRPQVARLTDPLRDRPRWQTLDLVVRATPVTAVDRDGHAVHLLASDPRGGLWHARIGAEAGEPTQLAEGIAADRPAASVDREGCLVVVFADRVGRLHLVTVGRDGQVGHEEALGGDFSIPLAVVEDGDELLLTALDAEDRVAVRTLRGEAAWEALGSLDELLEGPTDPVRLDETKVEPASTA